MSCVWLRAGFGRRVDAISSVGKKKSDPNMGQRNILKLSLGNITNPSR